jgi:CBS domain-containing protein
MTVIAADIMTRHVLFARSGDTVAAVAKLLSNHNISAVPVCDEHAAVIGMVSEGDLIRPFGEANELKRAWWLDLLAEGSTLAPAFLAYISHNRHCARDVMVSPVITASETTSLPAIADLFSKHHIKRVPIMRGNAMVGIVSRADLLRALAQMPEADFSAG